MNCNCKATEVVLSAIILIVTIWPNILGSRANFWVVIIAAAILLLHALKHSPSVCHTTPISKGKAKSRASNRRKRR
ncbi:MAG: hypothetical protein ACE5ES_01890 [Candidatus Nanoarchaeia archaeon]